MTRRTNSGSMTSSPTFAGALFSVYYSRYSLHWCSYVFLNSEPSNDWRLRESSVKTFENFEKVVKEHLGSRVLSKLTRLANLPYIPFVDPHPRLGQSFACRQSAFPHQAPCRAPRLDRPGCLTIHRGRPHCHTLVASDSTCRQFLFGRQPQAVEGGDCQTRRDANHRRQ